MEIRKSVGVLKSISPDRSIILQGLKLAKMFLVDSRRAEMTRSSP